MDMFLLCYGNFSVISSSWLDNNSTTGIWLANTVTIQD